MKDTSLDEFKDGSTASAGVKFAISKFEYDLFVEESANVVEKIIRVKRFAMPNKGEKWKIFHDTKVIFVIEGNKLLKKEREYLQTVNGFNFILAQAKSGIQSLNQFKIELKKTLSQEPDVAESPTPVKEPVAPVKEPVKRGRPKKEEPKKRGRPKGSKNKK